MFCSAEGEEDRGVFHWLGEWMRGVEKGEGGVG